MFSIQTASTGPSNTSHLRSWKKYQMIQCINVMLVLYRMIINDHPWLYRITIFRYQNSVDTPFTRKKKKKHIKGGFPYGFPLWIMASLWLFHGFVVPFPGRPPFDSARSRGRAPRRCRPPIRGRPVPWTVMWTVMFMQGPCTGWLMLYIYGPYGWC